MEQKNPKLSSKYLILEGPEPLYYVCLSVTPAVSGVRRAEEHQKLSSVPRTLYYNTFSIQKNFCKENQVHQQNQFIGY